MEMLPNISANNMKQKLVNALTLFRRVFCLAIGMREVRPYHSLFRSLKVQKMGTEALAWS